MIKFCSRLNLGVFLLFLLLILILRSPTLPNLLTGYLGGTSGDSGLYVWIYNYLIENRLSRGWFESNAFYPYQGTLAWSDNFLLPAFLGYLLSSIGIVAPFSYNLIFLLSSTLCGFATYHLAQALFKNHHGSIIAGASFMLWNYHTAMMGHPQLQFVFFLPLNILLMVRLLVNPTLKKGVILGLALSATFYTTVYYAVFSVLLCLVTTITFVIAGKLASLKTLALSFLGTAIGIIPILPAIRPYLDVMQTFTARGIYEPYYFSADTWSYLSSSAISSFYYFTSAWTHSEAYLFPGLINLSSLLVIGLCFKKDHAFRPFFLTLSLFLILSLYRRYLPGEDQEIIRFLLQILAWCVLFSLVRVIRRGNFFGLSLVISLTTISLILSFGPIGSPSRGEFLFSPHALFYQFFPGFGALRAISRIGVIVTLGLSLILAWIVANHKGNKYRLLSIVVPVLLLENFTKFQPIEELPKSDPILEDALHAASLRSEAVIFLPFSGELDKNGEVVSWGEFARLNTNAMLLSVSSNVEIINGYSGQKTKIMRSLPRELKNFPDQRSLSALCAISNLSLIIDKKNKAQETSLKFNIGELKVIDQNKQRTIFQLNCSKDLSFPSEFIAPAKTTQLLLSMRIKAESTIRVEEYLESSFTSIKSIDGLPGDNLYKLNLPLPLSVVRPRRFRIISTDKNSTLLNIRAK